MIFPGLTVFQNVLFVMACLGMVLIISYIILETTGYHKHKKNINTDDIDDNTENFQSVGGFLFNAFSLRGSIFWFTTATAVAFMLSMYLLLWLSIVIGVLAGAVVAIIIALLDRTPLGEVGELGIVSVKIPPEKQGFGKVILVEDNSELDAETDGKSIKKGKKVIIIKNEVNKVLVKKFRKAKNGRRKI